MRTRIRDFWVQPPVQSCSMGPKEGPREHQTDILPTRSRDSRRFLYRNALALMKIHCPTENLIWHLLVDRTRIRDFWVKPPVPTHYTCSKECSRHHQLAILPSRFREKLRFSCGNSLVSPKSDLNTNWLLRQEFETSR